MVLFFSQELNQGGAWLDGGHSGGEGAAPDPHSWHQVLQKLPCFGLQVTAVRYLQASPYFVLRGSCHLKVDRWGRRWQ